MGENIHIDYVITDGNGRWIHRDAVGRYLPTTNIILAERFESRSKAQNILQSCINKNLRKGYRIEEIVENSATINGNRQSATNVSVQLEVRPKINEAKRISEKVIEESLIDTWRNGISSILETIHSAEGRKEELVTFLSDIDKEISDIQHYIELSEHLNAYQGWLAYCMLRQRLRQRRKIKDELAILTQLGESKVSVDEINKIMKSIEGLSTRHYEPRVLKELFV